jgi:uncharacterized protein (DUF697 family)
MTDDPKVKKIIRRTTISTAVVAAVFSPIPLLDEILLFPMHMRMARRIAKATGLKFMQTPWRALAKTAVSGLIARGILNLAVAHLPGVAMVVNASTGVALTQFYGRYALAACEDPASAKAITVKEIVALMRARKQMQKTAAAAA